MASTLELSAVSTTHFTQISYDHYNAGDYYLSLAAGTYLASKGWSFVPFFGTTGRASAQVAASSGVLGFRGREVVISTRGTSMMNWDDWFTNFRFSRSPFSSLFSYLFPALVAKEDTIAAQFFGGAVNGQVANGFLQTHLSSWEEIKNEILDYSRSLSLLPSDLFYTVVGHSKGAAKATLNELHLLTDEDLAIGTTKLEASFSMSDSFVLDLGLSSGFFGIAKTSNPTNPGNVNGTVFESPRVYSAVAAGEADAIIGPEHLIRMENKKDGGCFLFRDNVVDVAPDFVGFVHIGTCVGVEGKGLFLLRHPFKQSREQAVSKLEQLKNDSLPSRQELSLPLGKLFLLFIFLSGFSFCSLLVGFVGLVCLEYLCVRLNELF